jgi:hypothetical protein
LLLHQESLNILDSQSKIFLPQFLAVAYKEIPAEFNLYVEYVMNNEKKHRSGC